MYKFFLPIILFLTVQIHGFNIWSHDTRQIRPELIFSQNLQNAANFKAQLLLTSGVYAHCIENYCPNKMIKDFGCKNDYNDNTNYVESFLIGPVDMDKAYSLLLLSPSHRAHLLGEGWFSTQNYGAVGFYTKDSNNAYVFLAASCFNDSKIYQEIGRK